MTQNEDIHANVKTIPCWTGSQNFIKVCNMKYIYIKYILYIFYKIQTNPPETKAMKSNSKSSFKVSHCQVHWPHPSEHHILLETSACAPGLKRYHQIKGYTATPMQSLEMWRKSMEWEWMVKDGKGRILLGAAQNDCSPKWIPKKNHSVFLPRDILSYCIHCMHWHLYLHSGETAIRGPLKSGSISCEQSVLQESKNQLPTRKKHEKRIK